MTLEELKAVADAANRGLQKKKFEATFNPELVLKLLAFAEAAGKIDAAAWDYCEYHNYAEGVCSCGHKDLSEAISAIR